MSEKIRFIGSFLILSLILCLAGCPRPVPVEGNTLPSYDMCQNYGHIDNKTGVKPRFVEILGEEYFK